jgi:hypothetical protein
MWRHNWIYYLLFTNEFYIIFTNLESILIYFIIHCFRILEFRSFEFRS